jgi:hypothetical protein
MNRLNATMKRRLIFWLLTTIFAMCGCNYLISSTGGGDGDATQIPSMIPSGAEAGDNAQESNSDTDLIALSCPAETETFLLTVNQDLHWRPPQTFWFDVTGAGLYYLSYTPYNLKSPGKEGGTLFIQNAAPTKVNIDLTWPDCVKEKKSYSAEYTPVVSGECRAAKMTLTYSERWASTMLDVFCEPGTRLGGDDGKQTKLPLPFALGGEALVDLKFGFTETDVYPKSTEVPFLGAGGSGEKLFQLTRFGH